MGSSDSSRILQAESHLEVQFYVYKWIKSAAGMRMRTARTFLRSALRAAAPALPCIVQSSITADHYHATTPRFTPHTRLVVLFSESLSVSNWRAVGGIKRYYHRRGEQWRPGAGGPVCARHLSLCAEWTSSAAKPRSATVHKWWFPHKQSSSQVTSVKQR